MPILQKYDDNQKPTRGIFKHVASGVESPNNKGVELQVLVPVIRHPEVPKLVRATDPTDGWMGWIKWEEPKETKPTPEPEPEQTPEEQQAKADKREFDNLVRDLKSAKNALELGVFTQEELKIPEIKARIRELYKPEYL